MAAPFTLASIMAGMEKTNPKLKEERIAREQAAAAKAAYAAIPYATHLANAQAELARAKEAQAAWKPAAVDTSKMTAFEQQAAKSISRIRGLAGLDNPTIAPTKAAEAKVQNLIKGNLQDQLSRQATGYGFGWKGNKSADYHTGQVANKLMERGITDLTQLGYSKDKKNLINKETGAIVPWHKNTQGMLGWSAKGKGLTKYKVQEDAQGNPVLFPKWKSNAPGGIGGFLLKAAPVLTSFIPGVGVLGAAAINAGLTGLQGGNLGAMLKSGAFSAAGQGLSNVVGKAAAANLPNLGNAAVNQAVARAIGNAASGGARSAITGRDVLSGAATGAVGSLIGSGAQGIANLLPGKITGVEALDRNIPGVVAGTIGNVARGQDVDSALIGSALGAAGGEAVNALSPNVGSSEWNALLQKGMQMGASQLLGSAVGSSASGARPPAAGSTASQATGTPTAINPATGKPTIAGSTGGLSDKYLALFPLLAASMSQQQEAPQQQLARLNPLDLNKMFGGTSLYAKGGKVSRGQSMNQLLALLRSSGKIA